MLRRHLGQLPCEDECRCPSSQRWDEIREKEGEDTCELIHATYDFANVEELVDGANVVFDEQPAFNEEVTNTSKSAFLITSINEILSQSDSDHSWVDLVGAVLEEDDIRLEEYQDILENIRSGQKSPGSGFIHAYGQDVAIAIAHAEKVLDGERYFGRYGDTLVVLDKQGSLRQIHQPPDLSEARCVIGLDAFPSLHLWRLNTVEDLQIQSVLTSDERSHWRTDRRGLNIVQVGRYDRPYTQGWRGKHSNEKAKTIINELRRHYGAAFRTSISSKSIEDDVKRMLSDVGVEKPATMHFGNLKSRNDFDGESVGLVVGCIDPGDDRILDLLALRDLNALPKFDQNGEREYGREFEGPDADAAAEFLASVRENNLAQAVGRYARDPEDEDSEAIVYVWSSALPDSLTDRVVPGVISRITDLKDEIEQLVRRKGVVTNRDVVDELGASKTYAYDTLQEMAEQSVVEISERTGDRNANEYHYIDGELSRSVDLGF